MNKQLNLSSYQKQKGVALAISLIMLLMLTIIGISNMESTIMEEKMAGNIIDRNRALQAAEAALRDGERTIEKAGSDIHKKVFYNAGVDDSNKTANNDGDSCLNGFCTPTEHTIGYSAPTTKKACTDATYTPDRWYDCPTGSNAASNNMNAWSTSNKHIVYTASNNTDLYQNPKYIIEFLGYVVTPGGTTTCTDANSDGIPDAPYDVWPNCPTDPQLYRITALGYGSSKNTKVMLQTTYIKTP